MTHHGPLKALKHACHGHGALSIPKASCRRQYAVRRRHPWPLWVCTPDVGWQLQNVGSSETAFISHVQHALYANWSAHEQMNLKYALWCMACLVTCPSQPPSLQIFSASRWGPFVSLGRAHLF